MIACRCRPRCASYQPMALSALACPVPWPAATNRRRDCRLSGQPHPRRVPIPPACRSAMADHVDHVAVWVANEETPDAPLLVGNRVHDLRAGRAYRLVGGVDVIDLDAEVRVYRGRRILGDEDDLGGGIGR